MNKKASSLYSKGFLALVLAISAVPGLAQAAPYGCQHDFSVMGSGGSGKTFSTSIIESGSPPQDAYLRLYHEIWKEQWRDERGSPQTLQVSAVNSASTPGRPQRLMVEISPSGQGSKVFVSFHIQPGDYASNSVTRREMCGMLADAFSGPALWLPPAAPEQADPVSSQQSSSSAVASNEQLHEVNAMNFTLAGIKLGMSYPQALNALAKFTHVRRSAIHKNWFHKISRNVPESIWVQIGSNAYQVTFEHRVPGSRKNPAVVESIEYDLLPWTAGNAKAMLKAAIQRYGAPTTESVGEDWCAKAFSGSCALNIPVLHCCMDPAPGIGNNPMGGAGLFLSDAGYTLAWDHYEDKKETKTPKF